MLCITGDFLGALERGFLVFLGLGSSFVSVLLGAILIGFRMESLIIKIKTFIPKTIIKLKINRERVHKKSIMKEERMFNIWSFLLYKLNKV